MKTNLEVIREENKLIDNILNDCIYDNQIKILELKLEEFFTEDLLKFEAMAEFEKAEKVSELLWICRMINKINFYPGVASYEELGREILNDDNIINNYFFEDLQDYIDFKGYARDYIHTNPKKSGFVSLGYIEMT